MNGILIHACCAHCLAKTLAGLRGEFGTEADLRAFWYNPNIHPLLEYRRRLKAVRVLHERDPAPLEIVDEYGLMPFCQALAGEFDAPARCAVCYRLRLDRAAARARELGLAAFTSTLVTSTHQSHAPIREAGDAAAAAHDVAFLYRDLRAVKVEPKAAQGLYRQQYCGCVFSEADRFRDTSKHLYKGGGDA